MRSIRTYGPNHSFSQAVRRSLEKDPNKILVDYVVEELLEGRFDCYLIGGRTRDGLRIEHFGTNGVKFSDYDIWVRDSEELGELDLEGLFRNHKKEVAINRFGHPKWCVNGIEIDVGLISSCNLLNAGLDFPRNIKTAIKGSDLTTSSLAYGLQDGKLYDHLTIESLTKEVVDVNFVASDQPHILMARLLLHAERFNFAIGEQGLALVKDFYDIELDPKISDYLTYKGEEQRTDKILSRLRDIAAEKTEEF